MADTHNITPDPMLYQHIKKNHRIMAIDVGTHTFGLATGLLETSIATPLTVIKRKKYKDDIIHIKKIIYEWDIRALIFGLPINMDGTSGARVQATKTIARNIVRDTNLPYDFQDERLSTSAAMDRLVDIGVKPSSRNNIIDAHAAQIILENYFYRVMNK